MGMHTRSRSKVASVVSLVVLCVFVSTACFKRAPLRAGSGLVDAEVHAGSATTLRMKENATASRLVASGGRVSWYHGERHELIAYDTVVDRKYNTEVLTLEPDGTNRSCVTCDSSVPKGFVGQPAWHPDGEHLLIQVENAHSDHKSLNFLSFGIDNDLWIIRRDGENAERIFSPAKHGAVLHPQFSEDGTQVIFAERRPTGRSFPFLKGKTPGGENHWEGWRIHIAEFHIDREGEAKLSGHRTFTPKGAGFYETHGFTPDGRILFSFTSRGRAYVDEIHTVRQDGTDAVAEITSPRTWDEHGLYSPDGKFFSYMSSAFNPALEYPRDKPTELETELYIRNNATGKTAQITNFNETRQGKIVVSDYDWDKAGGRIVLQVAPQLGSGKLPELWIVDLGSR